MHIGYFIMPDTNNYFLICSLINSDDLKAIEDSLPETLKQDMDEVFRKCLKFEFHTADYHLMLATATGLRNSVNHLVKVSKFKRFSLYYFSPLFSFNVVGRC